MLTGDYIDVIQKYVNDNVHDCIISFERGMQYDLSSGKKYAFNWRKNHFLSMVAPREECILQYNHDKILECGKDVVFLDTGYPMWTEIIHDTNFLNEVKPNAKELK